MLGETYRYETARRRCPSDVLAAKPRPHADRLVFRAPGHGAGFSGYVLWRNNHLGYSFAAPPAPCGLTNFNMKRSCSPRCWNTSQLRSSLGLRKASEAATSTKPALLI